MLRHYNVIRQSARRIADAIDHTIEGFVDGRIEQEADFTSQMLGRIEEAQDGYQAKGVIWKAKVLTDKGRGAQEKQYGADFMGVLNIDLPDFKVNKGFLAQAKIASRLTDIVGLHSQCGRMLDLSPDSFVFLYGADGVIVVPAVSVMGANSHPSELYYRSAARFFEEHLESFIGDRNISGPSADTLRDLRERYEARSLLYLQARSTLTS